VVVKAAAGIEVITTGIGDDVDFTVVWNAGANDSLPLHQLVSELPNKRPCNEDRTRE